MIPSFNEQDIVYIRFKSWEKVWIHVIFVAGLFQDQRFLICLEIILQNFQDYKKNFNTETELFCGVIYLEPILG